MSCDIVYFYLTNLPPLSLLANASLPSIEIAKCTPSFYKFDFPIKNGVQMFIIILHIDAKATGLTMIITPQIA